ncbi:AaceriAGR369Wp [[Ashbya] aceris (nom. inval.)]|nr:AaceriAGR369Wp [[Ashbya] aceris (nom. inval.)]
MSTDGSERGAEAGSSAGLLSSPCMGDGSDSAQTKKRNTEVAAGMKARKKLRSEESGLSTLVSIASFGGQASPDRSKASKQQNGASGHRPVTSCTHCRQHKIKCNASENFPSSCSRCERMGLQCEIDPQFRPKKGSQLQNLKNEIEELKTKLEFLLRSEGILSSAMRNSDLGRQILQAIKLQDSPQQQAGISVQTYLASEPELLKSESSVKSSVNTPSGSYSASTVDVSRAKTNSVPPLLNDSAPANSNKESLPPVLQMALKYHNSSHNTPMDTPSSHTTPMLSPEVKKPVVATTNAMPLLPSPYANIDEFVLGDVHIPIDKAKELHHIFVKKYLPYFPIMTTDSVTELYSQSQLLFWTVMLTACLSDPEPTLYNSLASLIKQLAIETCWIRTPRSTHISQALLILCNWPLPNQKVLDDCSYRFVGLAKSLSFQLGLHRGEFMSEFTRTQTLMPDAEKWRTRTWLGIFFAEQCWSSILGLPSTSQTDYFIEQARRRKFDLPVRFHRLLCLAHFQASLSSIMGSSVESPDGLMDAKERAGSLAALEQELSRLHSELKFDSDPVVEMYYLYAKLMIYCFAFLPETPKAAQTQYVTDAYLAATRIITLLTKTLEDTQLIELPIYVRQSVTYAALVLFKLHLTPYLPDKYVDSARQSIVTVHRLYRNQLTAWATGVENDISRTASVLEKLNFVLITYPEIFVEEEGIISRMRSHLTGTLFYDLVYCVHEARRRQVDSEYNEMLEKSKKEQPVHTAATGSQETEKRAPTRRLFPLPFYNQISKEDFETITQTTPGGTTVTTLVPTKNAILQAKKLQRSQGGQKGEPIRSINGIPLAMLDATGSVNGTLVGDNLNSSVPQAAVAASAPPEPAPSAPAGQSYPVFQPSYAQPAANVPMQRSASASVAEALSFRRPGMPKITSESIASGNPNSLFGNDSPPFPAIAQKSAKPAPPAKPEAPPAKQPAPYPNLNVFLGANASARMASYSSLMDAADPLPPDPNRAPLAAPGSLAHISELDSFFLQQSAGWIEGSSSNDDFLGWYDINMAPEF